MLRETTNPEPGEYEPLHFPHARRRSDHTFGETHLVTKERKRRHVIAYLVARERHELLADKIRGAQVRAPEQRMMTPAKKRITLSQEHAALDLLRQGPARCKPERCSLLLQTADHVGAAHLLALELNARIVAMEFGKETVISGEINA